MKCECPLQKRINELEVFVQRYIDTYDCDKNAHKFRHICLRCEATELMKKENE